MTAINRLTTKPTLDENDLIPIWDSEAGRTRNILPQNLVDYIESLYSPVVDVDYTLDLLTLTYANGDTKQIQIDRAIFGADTPNGNVTSNGSRAYIRQYTSGSSNIKEMWFNPNIAADTGWIQVSSFSEAV